MDTPSSSGPEPADDRRAEGVGAISASLLAAVLDHLEARVDLFRWEVGEAKSRLVRRIAAVVVAIVFIAIAYLLGIAALVGWIAGTGVLSWPAALGATAGAHLLIALVLLLLARKRPSGEWFPDSRKEFRRDRENLKRRAEASRPR